MKTAEKIKKGLECCHQPVCPKDCPYNKPDGICELTDDIETYIQQLEAQVPRWISVEERVPENYETVIIWRSDCHVATIGWLICDVWSVPKGVRVTHWMHLPEMPKEDEA